METYFVKEKRKEFLLVFGRRVRRLRISRGLTQLQLANLVGYESKVAITRLESGQAGVGLDRLYALAIVLNTTPNYLLGFK